MSATTIHRWGMARATVAGVGGAGGQWQGLVVGMGASSAPGAQAGVSSKRQRQV
jgi:hypothetical protein